MYQVSEAYRKAIIKKHRKYKIEGTITLKNGTVIPFSDQNISEGSLVVENQCVNGEAFELGSVYAGQLSMTIKSDIDRYSLYDGVVKLSFFLQTEPKVYEEVPLGVYNINEPVRKGSYISLKALDNMVYLDVDFSDKASNGKAWDILGLISELTGIENGMTKEYVESLPNGTSNLRVPATFQMNTMRDLIAYLSAAMGCFAAMDRAGKLVFVRFGKKPALTIEPGFRTLSEFADFTVRYTALSTVVNGSVQLVSLEDDNGMTLTLEENPFFQVEDEKVMTYLLTSLLSEISEIQYVPSTVSLYGDPSIDLGDMVLYKLLDGTEIASITTAANFKYRAEQSVKSVGKNPRLAVAKSKEQKKLDQISGQVSAKDIIFYSFINAKAFSITTKDSLIYIDFVTQEGRMAEFKASILLSTKATGGTATIVKAIYYRNNEEITTYYPIETYADGSHVLFLYYPLTGLDTNKMHKFEVFLEVSGGTVTIEKGQAIATVSGQGLAAGSSEWDGNLDFEENIGLFSPAINFIGFKDEMKAEQNVPHENALEEAFGLFSPAINFVGFTAEPSDEVVIRSNLMDTFSSDSKYVISDAQSVRLKTQYVRTSTPEEIDTGTLAALDLSSEWRRMDTVDISVTVVREPEVT